MCGYFCLRRFLLKPNFASFSNFSHPAEEVWSWPFNPAYNSHPLLNFRTYLMSTTFICIKSNEAVLQTFHGSPMWALAYSNDQSCAHGQVKENPPKNLLADLLRTLMTVLVNLCVLFSWFSHLSFHLHNGLFVLLNSSVPLFFSSQFPRDRSSQWRGHCRLCRRHTCMCLPRS